MSNYKRIGLLKLAISMVKDDISRAKSHAQREAAIDHLRELTEELAKIK